MCDERHLYANQFTTYLQPDINWSESYFKLSAAHSIQGFGNHLGP